MNVPFKKCTKCNRLKPLSLFYKSSLGANGLMSCCKECHIKITGVNQAIRRDKDEIYYKNYYKNYHSKNFFKQCTKCGEIKPFIFFSKDATKRNNLRSSCNQCKSKTDFEYIKNNRIKVRQQRYRYYKKNKEKVDAYRRQYWRKNREKRAMVVSKSDRKACRLLKKTYVIKMIIKHSKLKREDVTPQLIEFKRELLLFFREMRQLKRRLKNGTA